MNFLEIINKCLVELNYKQVNNFAELTKNEHKKIMNILNVLNSEVCQYAKWNFLLRKATLTLPAGMNEIDNTINGRISQLLIDSHEFHCYENASDIINRKVKGKNLYSGYDGKIIFAKTFDEDKNVEVIYYTYNSALNAAGEEISSLTEETDSSAIPMPFVEPILVFGTCMRLKGNPQHIRFNYWVSMYKDALANMVSRCSIDSGFEPVVRLRRS